MTTFAKRMNKSLGMIQKISVYGALTMLLLCTSCTTSHYQLTGIERNRIVVDKRYDGTHDKVVEMIMRPYKEDVDTLMGPVVGKAAQNMSAKRPESLLSNLLADILVWSGKPYQEQPDFSVYNMGGIRASFSKGDVTIGDVLDVAPFENKLCFLTLNGIQVLRLFEQIASVGGEGVSHGVKLVISRDGKLKSALLNGKKVDSKKNYRIATLDYLAEGNDKLVAFKQKENALSPREEKNNVRFIIMNYFKEQAAKGLAVDSKMEGRIVVE